MVIKYVNIFWKIHDTLTIQGVGVSTLMVSLTMKYLFLDGFL